MVEQLKVLLPRDVDGTFFLVLPHEEDTAEAKEMIKKYHNENQESSTSSEEFAKFVAGMSSE